MQALNAQLVSEVTAFLNFEADLLDSKDYETWLTLWAENGFYIVPVEHNVTDYAASLNVAYDDHEMRLLRVQRLTSGDAVSTVDADNTVRTVTGVTVLSENSEEVKVRCKYCLYENNKHGVRQFPATLLFTLIREQSGFKLKEKVVKVMKSNQYLTTVNYLF